MLDRKNWREVVYGERRSLNKLNQSNQGGQGKPSIVLLLKHYLDNFGQILLEYSSGKKEAVIVT